MYIVLKTRSTTFADLTDKFPIKFLLGVNVFKQNLLISIIKVVLFWTDRNGFVVIMDELQCCCSEPITIVLY
jgi:hypothetical protein